MLLSVELNVKYAVRLVKDFVYSLEHAEVVAATTVVLETIMEHIFNEV